MRERERERERERAVTEGWRRLHNELLNEYVSSSVR
jgi:hypothetical protein